MKHDHRRSFGECFFNLWKGQIDPLRSNVPRDDITLVRFGGPQGLPFEPLEPPSKLMRGMIVFPSVSEPDVSVLAQLWRNSCTCACFSACQYSLTRLAASAQTPQYRLVGLWGVALACSAKTALQPALSPPSSRYSCFRVSNSFLTPRPLLPKSFWFHRRSLLISLS